MTRAIAAVATLALFAGGVTCIAASQACGADDDALLDVGTGLVLCSSVACWCVLSPVAGAVAAMMVGRSVTKGGF